MAQQNAPGNPIPPAPPEAVLEYLLLLSQSSALSSLPIPHHVSQPTTSIPDTPTTPTPPPTKARKFDRVGRGTGGALSEKQKVSKQITAPATKRKSTVDPDNEIKLSPSLDAAESSNPKQPKRSRTGKVSRFFEIFRSLLTQLRLRQPLGPSQNNSPSCLRDQSTRRPLPLNPNRFEAPCIRPSLSFFDLTKNPHRFRHLLPRLPYAPLRGLKSRSSRSRSNHLNP